MSDCKIEAVGLTAGYGAGVVVRDVDLQVRAGEVTVVLGPNGAGKTTTLLAMAGELPLMGGHVVWQGSTKRRPLFKMAREGLAYIADEHAIARGLTVRDNLRLSLKKPNVAFDMFPELAAHKSRVAGLLSGGQQRMLTLAMALAKKPDVVFADELSLGLAPQIVQRLLQTLREAANGGVAVLLVEQHAQQALAVADNAVVLSRGRIVMKDTAANVRAGLGDLSAAYLGGAEVGATS